MRPDIEQGIFRTHPPEKERATAMTKQLTDMNVPIRRRDVTTMLKVAVRTVPLGNDKTASEVTLDNRLLFRTPSRQRADESAKTLDRLLNEDVQLYDVTRRGTQVLVRGETVWNALPEDAALASGAVASTTPPASPQITPAAQATPTPSMVTATPEKAAENAYKALRNALFKQFLENGE